MSQQVLLIILDGWGMSEDKEYNAIHKANTPFFDYLWDNFPHTLLNASGKSVGLPDGQMGNSEVGHMTIGAGKKIEMDLVRIAKVINENKLLENKTIRELFAHAKKNNSFLHLIGLLGDGGIHAHDEHLHAILKEAEKFGLKKVVIHIFTDGRDTAMQSASKYLINLENLIQDLGIGHIATASGRYYGMDRDNNWERIEKVEKAIFHNTGKIYKNKKPSEVLQEIYKENIIDETLEPIVFLDQNNFGYKIDNNDSVLFMNFRADRARMMASKISKIADEKNIYFATLTEYDKKIKSHVVFSPIQIETTLANEISKNNLTQAHISETEKYAHVTYYLNGGDEIEHKGEVFELIASRKDIKTHDLAPKMRAREVADKVMEHINKGTNFICVNFANADMVGHTANEPAILQALEEVDLQLKRVMEAAEKNNSTVLVIADHGNAEKNFDIETNEKHTAHTSNLVPAILNIKTISLRNQGSLADIAPTLLQLLDLNQPKSMIGISLINKR